MSDDRRVDALVANFLSWLPILAAFPDARFEERHGVPSWTSSFNQSVQVSLDDPSFASPIPARLDGTNWSLAVPTPAVGQHTLYARATQGFDTGGVASRSFTVTK